MDKSDSIKSRNTLFLKASKRSKRSEKFRKFIGNKTEGQGFADKRKKKIQYEYLKTLKKERRKNEKTGNFDSVSHKQSMSPKEKGQFKSKGSANRYTKVKEEAQKRKDKGRLKKEEAEKRHEEREKALGTYKKKKKENFKKLCKKTHRGQPVMKNQMEYLLAKIEKQYQLTKGENT